MVAQSNISSSREEREKMGFLLPPSFWAVTPQRAPPAPPPPFFCFHLLLNPFSSYPWLEKEEAAAAKKFFPFPLCGLGKEEDCCTTYVRSQTFQLAFIPGGRLLLLPRCPPGSGGGSKRTKARIRYSVLQWKKRRRQKADKRKQ